jgi:hypothetical protein
MDIIVGPRDVVGGGHGIGMYQHCVLGMRGEGVIH